MCQACARAGLTREQAAAYHQARVQQMQGPNGTARLGGSARFWRRRARISSADMWLNGVQLALLILVALVVCGGAALILI